MFCIFPAISLPRAFKLEATETGLRHSPLQMFFGLFEISGHVSPSENSHFLMSAIYFRVIIMVGF